MSLPDKHGWKKYRFRKIGQDYEDYETARKCLKRAEETSNLESDEDSRKRKLPSRLISETESDADVESDMEGMPSPPKTKFLQKRNLHKQSTPVRKESTLLPLSPPPPDARNQMLFSSHVKRRLLSTSVRRSLRSKPGYTSLNTEKSPERAASSSSVLSTSTSVPRPMPVRRSPRSKPGYTSLNTSTEKSPERSTFTPSTRNTSTSAPRPIPADTNTGTYASMRLPPSEGTIFELLHQFISKMDTLQRDVAAIKHHLISSLDIDGDNIDCLLPSN